MNAREFLELPPAKACEVVSAMTAEEVWRLDDEITGIMCAAAWKVGYLRGAYAGHRESVGRANRLLRGVRKLAGFAYPAAGEIHV